MSCHATTSMPQAYQPYQSIRHSVEAIGGKSISAVNLGRTCLEMMDSIHTLLILLLRHHEDIMMRVEELKLEKVANEDMEVFPDGRRTQIFHIQIEGFTKLSTWISGAGNKNKRNKNTRDSPRFLILTTKILNGIWICTLHQCAIWWQMPNLVRPIQKLGSCKSGNVNAGKNASMACLTNLNLPKYIHPVVHLGQTHSNTQKIDTHPVHVENIAEVVYLEDPWRFVCFSAARPNWMKDLRSFSTTIWKIPTTLPSFW